MSTVFYIITVPYNTLMAFCYNMVNNCVLAISVFTLLTRIILLPIALWVQKRHQDGQYDVQAKLPKN